MARCDRCPVPADIPCDGQFCRLAGTAPHWDRHIAGRAVLVASAADGPPTQAAVPRDGPRPLAATLEVLELVKGCDHRWPDPTACSCTAASFCSLRSATVYPPDCDACASG